jgi:hypothetical protein
MGKIDRKGKKRAKVRDRGGCRPFPATLPPGTAAPGRSVCRRPARAEG